MTKEFDNTKLLIGVASYQKDQLYNWVYSIRHGNDTCRVVLISAVKLDGETIEFLNYYNVGYLYFKYDISLDIHLQRFGVIKTFLSGYRDWLDVHDPVYVLTTDVRDVAFVCDPFEPLKQRLKENDKQIIAGSEGLLYKDEEWNYQNIIDTFEHDEIDVLTKLTNKEVVNVGVLFGYLENITELCGDIFVQGHNKMNRICDQAVFNKIIHLDKWKDKIDVVTHDDGLICHCGVTLDPSKIDKFSPKLLCKKPVFKNHVVMTQHGVPYPIVHQYDRLFKFSK